MLRSTGLAPPTRKGCMESRRLIGPWVPSPSVFSWEPRSAHPQSIPWSCEIWSCVRSTSAGHSKLSVWFRHPKRNPSQTSLWQMGTSWFSFLWTSRQCRWWISVCSTLTNTAWPRCHRTVQCQVRDLSLGYCYSHWVFPPILIAGSGHPQDSRCFIPVSSELTWCILVHWICHPRLPLPWSLCSHRPFSPLRCHLHPDWKR